MISEFEFNLFHRAKNKHETSHALSRLRTDGKETTDLGDDHPVYSAKNIQVTAEKISKVYLGAKCNIKMELITGRSEDYLVKNGETCFCTVEPTELDSTKGALPTIRDFPVDESEDKYCGMATVQVARRRGSEFHADHSARLVRKSRIYCWLITEGNAGAAQKSHTPCSKLSTDFSTLWCATK